jgi:hypothetical protein
MNRTHKLILYLTIILVTNILISKYSFNQDSNRLISLISFLALIFAVFRFSIIFPGLFTKKQISYSVINDEEKIKDKLVQKHMNLTVFVLLFIVGLIIGFQFLYFSHTNRLLVNNGLTTRAIVKKKEWVIASRGPSTGYYIYYHIVVNNKIYRFNRKNEKFEVGDTLFIRYLPSNPNQHEIINNCP